MTYIITATKSEAQAFIEKFHLGAKKSNDLYSILVSGVGNECMDAATQSILSQLKESDTLVNIGICGASDAFEIGALLQIDTTTQCINASKKILTCADEALGHANLYAAVDMESSGFIQASKTFKNRYMFKVVSDHFEPSKVTKDKTKKLIYAQIDTIMEILNESSSNRIE